MNRSGRYQGVLIARIAALLATAIGLLVMTGWILNIDFLKGALWPGLIVMKGNAALCAALAGTSLFLTQLRLTGARERVKSAFALALGWTVIFITSVTLIEYLFGWDAGIDQLIFTEGATAAGFYPSRMAFMAAVGFFLTGIALVLPKGRRSWLFVQTLSFIVLWLSMITLLGLLFGATALYVFDFSVAAAHVAAVALVILSFGVLFSRYEDGFAKTMNSELMGGKMARRLAPVIILILIGGGLLETIGRRTGAFTLELGVAISVAVSVTIFSFLVWLNARSLNRHEMEITEAQKELATANAALAQQVVEMAALNAELEAFAFAVSHDLRSPLRSIDGFSQILAEDYADKMNQQELDYFTRIRAAATRMGQLIDDILKLSRVTRGDINYEPLDISAMAVEIADQKRGQYPEQKVGVTIDPGLTAVGDKGLVTAALENLLDNSWKYTSRTDNAEIEVGVEHLPGEDLFYVKDNGVGFEQIYVDKLFKPFQRLHRDADFPGTGIGLATVKRIVNRHGGRTLAESLTDSGAIFYFSLAPRDQKGETNDRG